MLYDYYQPSWSPTTGPNAPLHTCNAASGSLEASIASWIKSGFPACKILMVGLCLCSVSHSVDCCPSSCPYSLFPFLMKGAARIQPLVHDQIGHIDNNDKVQRTVHEVVSDPCRDANSRSCLHLQAADCERGASLRSVIASKAL
jgi:hypothetical protein